MAPAPNQKRSFANEADTLAKRALVFMRATKGFRRLAQRYWPSTVCSVDEFTFRIWPARNMSDSVIWYYGEIPEPESRAAFMKRCTDGPCHIVDVGANSGLFSIFFASRSHSDSRIIAAEPNPLLVEQITENLSLNPGAKDKVTIVQKAIGEEGGAITLNIQPANMGASSVHKFSANTRGITVQQTELLSLLNQKRNGDFLAVKIDVEGYEDHVIGPVLHDAPDDELPDQVLLEVDKRHVWDVDLSESFRKRGYALDFSGDGNELWVLERAQ